MSKTLPVPTIERLIAEGDIDAARRALKDYLYEALSRDEQNGSIAEAISILASEGALHSGVAVYLLRCLAVQGLLPPSNPANLLFPNLVTLCERAIPQVCRLIGLESKRQTHEKIDLLQTVHARVSSLLAPFCALPEELADFLSAKQTVLHALGHSLITTYCQPFDIIHLRAGAAAVFASMSRLNQGDTDISLLLEECSQCIEHQLRFCNDNFSFLTQQFYRPFLHAAALSVERYVNKTRSRFVTAISCRLGASHTPLKRYPLHDEGRVIAIAIPMRSTGPGTALAATARLETDSPNMLFQEESLSLGDIAPGDFSMTCHAFVANPCAEFTFMLTISWNEVGVVERKESVCVINIAPQRPDIDWMSLAYRRPYSTEVAKGVDFVGRSEKVLALANNILRTPMDSFYITGQKRVGKTSLALAMLDFAKRHEKGAGLESLYLLWGAIAHEDPRASVKELGERIARFIQKTFPADQKHVTHQFEGTLATLIPLAETAHWLDKKKRYVILMDEFDEIHPELYMQGNLAETFFANIRAINTCENVCIVLVGGENMPFIMERQGQKLNKFVRVILDYFSRDEEWEDFKLLVRRPTEASIYWHDEAIAEIFNVTNGNPYFAKVICAKVYADAVKERDADVTVAEVRRAIAAEIGAFDVHLFAHLWQDGIHKPVQMRDPDIIRRCRVLVAIARTARKGEELTLENIISNKHSVELSDGEVQPVLNDFMRRDVLRESNGRYRFVLPIFGMWLVDAGINRLSSALSEELARSVQAAEDAAYIHSDEIAVLSRRWPTYRGHRIGTDEIRAWCEQVEGHRQQRLLFKLLQNLTIYGEEQIRAKLRIAHSSFVRPLLPEFVVRRRSDRRMDVLLTYVDGEGKSGQFYASRYAQQNAISTKAMIRPSELASTMRHRATVGVSVSAIVIVDDIIATGEAMSRNLRTIIEAGVLRDPEVPLIVIALTATIEGEARVREELSRLDCLDIDLRVCDILGPDKFAFGTGNMWADREECERAKALCVDLGVRIYRDNPLGYGGQGLLIVFPESCPNNTLPILHSAARPSSGRSWTPLFPRLAN